MIISSDQITILKEELDKDCIAQCMLLSLRQQRKDNVLCDAIIKCCNKEFPVHRSVLYAYSLYCRKLLLGSFPPKTENGLVEIDLDCFSENTVRVLLDVMYGDTSEESVNIDIEEFLKLADFLQVDYEIEVVTAIFRKLLSTDNCLEIYNLASTYNFRKLANVALTISGDQLKGDYEE